MKRAYVKPVMESEAFVANEYVAACWTIDCTNLECEARDYVYSDPTADRLYDSGTGRYLGTINGIPGCYEYTIEGESWNPSSAFEWFIFILMKIFNIGIPKGDDTVIPYHQVEVVSGHPNHPYASV